MSRYSNKHHSICVLFVALLVCSVIFLHKYFQIVQANVTNYLDFYNRRELSNMIPYTVLDTREDKHPRAVLVTGVAGYIGSHMALKLLERDFIVYGVDNLSRGSHKAILKLQKSPRFEFFDLDIGNKDIFNDLFRRIKFDTVFHFAGNAFVTESIHFPELYRANITENSKILVDLMVLHKIPRLVYSSSCAVYGNPETVPITESTLTRPVSPYGQAKLDAEKYITSHVSSTFKADLLRYFNVVGADSRGRIGENPRKSLAQYARLWTSCLDVVYKRKRCVKIRDSFLHTPDGTSIRDYVHVEDLVDAHLAVIEIPKENHVDVWNVAINNPVSTFNFIETARNVTGHFIPICFEQNSESFSPAALYATGDRLRGLTGWRPRYTDLHSMLETSWKWSTSEHFYKDTWKKNTYDICIVGAGLSSAVLAERHVQRYNHSVLVLEKRAHIGGNCYDYIDKETGIRVSKYGVHLFHTKFEKVWKYMQRFSKWTPWEHHCVAHVNGQYVPVPVNIQTVNSLFQLNISTAIEMETWLKTVQINPPNSREASNSEEVALQRVGKKLYEMIFKPYTIKQWDKDPSQLGPSVLARIPVRTNHDSRYFTDPYQALPSFGYTRIFENMFNSDRITVRLNTDYFKVEKDVKCGHLYYTGPIDSYFAAKGMPKLEYRSLEFDRVVYPDLDFFQPMAHVNYPSMITPYTRAIEYKHLLNQKSPHTVVFFERSTSEGEPYYPVPNKKNQNLYAKYQSLATQEQSVTFVGRLANYKYFNMDETVKNALEIFEKFEGHTKNNEREKEKQSGLFRQRILESCPNVPRHPVGRIQGWKGWIWVGKENGKLSIEETYSFQTRNKETIQMLKEVDARLSSFCNIPIYTDDNPPCNVRSLAYSTRRWGCKTIPIPSFIFNKWPEVGIGDYEMVVRELRLAAENIPKKLRTLGWIGNPNTHAIRRTLILKKGPFFDFREVFPGSEFEGYVKKPISGFMTLPEQIKEWQYILDVRGGGFSARLPLLLRSGRLVFYQERDLEQWFMPLFRPYVHYIPVSKDLSNLGEQVAWANADDVRSASIVRSCTELADRVLTRSNALDYLVRVLSSDIVNRKITDYNSSEHDLLNQLQLYGSRSVPEKGKTFDERSITLDIENAEIAKCTPGTYQNASQWRTLFPNGRFSFHRKALVSIPIGKKARKTVSSVITSMGHHAFDYLLFAYDDFSWKTEAWYHEPGVSVVHVPGGRMFQLYHDYLIPNKVSPYSHLFLWDDDIQPAPGFDGEVLLQFLQAFNLDIAQPLIRKNAHGELVDRGFGGTIREVKQVEIMVPCYSTKTWLECIRPRIIREFVTSWGIDSVLHSSGSCAPENEYGIRIPLDHMNFQSLTKLKGFSHQGYAEQREYQKQAQAENWPRRKSRALHEYSVNLNDDCKLSMQRLPG